MSKKYITILLPIISIASLLISACGASVSNAATQTQAVVAIYTAAALTIEANSASFTKTPLPTETPSPTVTITSTITPTATLTSIPPTSPMQNYCDNSLWISDVTIPDNTLIAPSQTFEKTWAIQNTGTCAWTESYSIIFVNGDMMNGSARTINQRVESQQQANISIKLTAPSKPGTYTGVWRLANSKGEPFGKIVTVVINVGVGGTMTVTAPAGSATPSNTPVITSTSAPTSVPSATPTLTTAPSP
jgi:hypothetical protein